MIMYHDVTLRCNAGAIYCSPTIRVLPVAWVLFVAPLPFGCCLENYGFVVWGGVISPIVFDDDIDVATGRMGKPS